MNFSSEQINQFKKWLEETRGVLILLGQQPKFDSVAAGLSLFLALTAKGKNVKIASPSPMIVEFNQLVGVDKITNNLNNLGNGKNLVISFPYQEGSIEKVSYNIENDTFNLVIEPREGYPKITEEMIRYSYSGGESDLIITIGVKNFEDLGNFYQDYSSLFSQKNLVNIDTEAINQRFGKINLVDPQYSSLSELVLNLFYPLGLSFDQDIAENLFAGIVRETNNFTSPKTQASTFEAAALCLKNGARKTMGYAPLPQSFSPSEQKTNVHPPYPPFPKTKQKTSPFPKPSFPEQQKPPETPPDWLKPKIYKGSTLV